ncbi:PREDICTED: uncharacterized protein LOC105457659 [Wasmannia auropunctata]|uniref:uncharacterized protein LOC105457659 n=1 Tax=Wasmannia auropunctata TaxID=64793 RepID=UPI0005F08367|nr:PREDICTED: uncharacterized protein LOC105457659 [Wasmannia auropunctata]
MDNNKGNKSKKNNSCSKKQKSWETQRLQPLKKKISPIDEILKKIQPSLAWRERADQHFAAIARAERERINKHFASVTSIKVDKKKTERLQPLKKISLDNILKKIQPSLAEREWANQHFAAIARENSAFTIVKKDFADRHIKENSTFNS